MKASCFASDSCGRASSKPPAMESVPLTLYVHVPWCRSKCPYCDFNSHPLRGNLDEPGYIEALHVAARTDLVAFVPRRLIAALSRQLSLQAVAPPFDPGIDEQHLFYPTRAQMDPGSIWLRNLMLGIGREMERGKTP